MSHLLWVGFGDLGQRALPQLLELGYQVTGARRSKPKPGSAAGALLTSGDAQSHDAWLSWLTKRPQSIVISLTPSAYTAEAYQASYVQPLQTLLSVLAELTDYQPSIYFISSTSVYGQAAGAWVDEYTSAIPDGFSGQTMLACEQLLLDSPYTGAILRCSGIYGPGRNRLLESVRTNSVQIRNEWTNRVHAEDVARAVVFLMERTHINTRMEVYAVTDCHPALHADVVTWLAQQLGVELRANSMATAVASPGSKRISNKKLKSVGFTFNYPSYKEGYKNLI